MRNLALTALLSLLLPSILFAPLASATEEPAILQELPLGLEGLDSGGGLAGGSLGLFGGGAEAKFSANFTIDDEAGVQVHVTAKLGNNWHIYSVTQPQGGPQRTVIKLDPSDQYQLTGEFKANSPPKIHPPDAFPVQSEEHYGEVTWSAPIRLSKGVDPAKLTIHGKLDCQVCQHDGGCVPVKENFAATYTQQQQDNGVATYRDANHFVTISGHIEPASVEPGQLARLYLTIEPAPGRHAYELSMTPPTTLLGNQPSIIAVVPVGGMQPQPPITDSPLEAAQPAPAPGFVSLPYHSAKAQWLVNIQVPDEAKPGEYPIDGMFGYQTCTDSSCDAPRGVRFQGQLVVGNPTDSTRSQLRFFESDYKAAAVMLKENPYPIKEIDWAMLPWMIGGGLLGGLLLNLMPCVLPVIGLKILSFVEQGGQSYGRVLLYNIAYSAGLLLVFLVLATMAVTLQIGWGEQFQSAAFGITLCALVFVMALSFLGVWEIPLPGFVGSGKAGALAAKEGLSGAFFKGVFTTVLATPCSGPFLGPVFGALLKQPSIITYVVFTCIGIGMASPYLLIGAVPSLIRYLPRPGPWMDTFKQLMAFVLLGTVVFIFTFVKQDYVIATFGLLVGLWLACWWIGRTPITASFQKKATAWIGGGLSAAAIGWVSFTLLGPHESILKWEPYTPQSLASAQAEGKTVLVDFTANWCATCKLNLKWAIDTQEVGDVVKANEVVPLLADWSDRSDEIKRALNKLGSNSIPVLAIYPAGRPEEVIILRDLLSESQVVEALKKAGPSKQIETAETASTAATVMN